MAFSRESAWWRLARRLVTRTLVIGACAGVLLAATIPVPPVPINVRWRADVDAAARAALEARYRLGDGRHVGGTTFAYVLADPSKANIRALVEDPRAEDTANLHRTAFRPPLARYRPWIVARSAWLTGLALAAASLTAPAASRLLQRRAQLPERRAVALIAAPPAVLLAAALVFTLATAAGVL